MIRIKNILKNLILYKVSYLKKNIFIAKNVKVGRGSNIDPYCVIHSGTVFKGHLGAYSYVGETCHLQGWIGKFCSIGPNVKVYQGVHPSSIFVSTSPMFYSKNGIGVCTFNKDNTFCEYRYADNMNNAIICGHDVWIGIDASIMAGVSIGNGAIIGAKALVTKDVPAYAIVAGVPAKIIRYRFEECEIEYLEKLKWWDRENNWIRDNIVNFKDIKRLMQVCHI